MQLVIVGNGFDIAHNIESKYIQFRKYLKQNDTPEYDFLCALFGNEFNQDEFWWNFEESLERADFSNLVPFIKPQENLLNQENGENENAGEIPEIILKAKILQLKKDFYQWISKAYNDKAACTQKKQLKKIFSDSIVLNFNYTSTVEDIYGKKSYHIHGHIKDVNIENDHDIEKIILGHADRGFSYESSSGEIIESKGSCFVGDTGACILAEDVFLCPQKWYSNDDAIQRSLSEASDAYTFQFTKKCQSIIKRDSTGFFKELRNNCLRIDKIVVLGHSLSQVDLEYLKEIVKILEPHYCSIQWIVSEHENNRSGIKEKINNIAPTENISFITI